MRRLTQTRPLTVRVQCPRGHFIANITLSVIDGQLTTRRERSGKDLRNRKFEGRPDFNGHLHVSADRNTVLQCAAPLPLSSHPSSTSQRHPSVAAQHPLRLRQEGRGCDVEEGCHDVDYDVAGGGRVECIAEDGCQAAGAENREVAAGVGGAVRAHD